MIEKKRTIQVRDLKELIGKGEIKRVERIIQRDLQLIRFEEIKGINNLFEDAYKLKTDFVYADEQNGLDYILISDLTQNFKVFNEEFYCYIELFYLVDKKGNYVITEVIVTPE